MRARGFFQAYKWLLSDFVKRAGLVLSQVTLLASAFILFRIFVFSAVVQLIKSIDYAFLSGQRELEVYPGYPLGLVEATVLAWCLVMLTATAGYLFYRSVFTSTHEHMQGLFERLLHALSTRPLLGNPFPVPQDANAKLLTQVTTHVRLVNILSRILLFSIFESLSFLACLGLLLWLHTPTTLVLLGAGFLFMPLYYYLSLEGIRNRRSLKPANRDLAEALRDFEAAVTVPGAQTSDVVKAFSQDPRIGTAFRLFQVQRMIVFKSEYAGWFLLASVAAICIFWIYYLSLQTVRLSDWYFGVFLVMMYSLVRSLRSIVSSNRFLDSAIFCHRILEHPKSAEPSKPLGEEVLLRFMETAKVVIDIAPGKLVVIEAPEVRNMFALGTAGAQLQARGERGLRMGLLPFDASSEDIEIIRKAGHLPVFEAPGLPDMDDLPDPLKALANNLPLLVLVRKRLGNRLHLSPPDLVLTVLGTEVVRYWRPETGEPFTPFSDLKSRKRSLEEDADDEEFL
ncbi:hypothetical protein N8Z54_04165 [Octadecabacter sp.]|nr:hypothetical protein [Octadecabacter sp.]